MRRKRRARVQPRAQKRQEKLMLSPKVTLADIYFGVPIYATRASRPFETFPDPAVKNIVGDLTRIFSKIRHNYKAESLYFCSSGPSCLTKQQPSLPHKCERIRRSSARVK